MIGFGNCPLGDAHYCHYQVKLEVKVEADAGEEDADIAQSPNSAPASHLVSVGLLATFSCYQLLHTSA